MSAEAIPLEEAVKTNTHRRKVSIGLPAASSAGERRFPLTPEGAAMLAERGFELRMEQGAAQCIHFSDEAYRRAGAKITNRAEAFGCDIVLHLPAISEADAILIKKGAVLLSLMHSESQRPAALRQLLRRHIIAIALDLITDADDLQPFADILREVDGRAAMAMASALLADNVHGKGILLGGVAGIVPCEVTIIGSGIAARSAARSALGLGATVRMFDNDVYRLRSALHELGQANVIGSALHPRVLANALRTADVVIATPIRYPFELGAEVVDEMKRGVIAFDLAECQERSFFPGLACIDLAMATPADCGPGDAVRTCFINAGSAVPRTAAMALSTTLLTLFDDILECDGMTNALKFNNGLRRAAYTFLGKAVNPDIARLVDERCMDINLFLNFS